MPRPIKRLKLDTNKVTDTEFAKAVSEQPVIEGPQSALFRQSRVLGVVTDSIPVSVNRLGAEHFVTASVGNSFIVYDVDHLHVAYMSPALSGTISCLLSIGDGTITATGNTINIWNKMVKVASLHGHKAPITTLETLGGAYLLSVDDLGAVLVWELPRLARDTKPLASPLTPTLSLPVRFQVTRAIAVPTYVN